MVVRNLPLVILPNVDEGITTLDLIASRSHSELVDACVLTPVVTNGNIALQNFTLGLLLQEANKVIFDQIVIGTWNIRNGGKKHCLGSITAGHSIGVFCCQRHVPKLEQVLNLLFGDSFGLSAFWHDRRMMLGDFPLSIFKDIDKGVTSLDLGTITHGELINTSILGPVGTNDDVTTLDLSLGLQLQEVREVINNSRVVVPWNIRHGRKQDSCFGVSVCHLLRILSRQSIIPQVEKRTNFLLRNGFCCDDTFWHHTRVVVVDLPFIIFPHVNEGVTALDLIACGSHGEFVNPRVLAPVVPDRDIALQDFTLGLLLQE
mmetsp:Transcript_7369/g.13420  ORF Transcript_7369/g.13420 Transcript_7369/m.13420 type:complete len:317 (+) Transcript_7369:327-1277(+)